MLDLKKMKIRLTPILYNTYLLCFIGIISTIDIIYLVIQNDIPTVSIFILVSIIAYFFSKNMIVILVLALAIANMYKYGNSINIEGLANMDENNEEMEEDVTENMDEEMEEEDVTENMENNETTEEDDETELDPFEEQTLIRKNMEEFLDTQDKILIGIKNMEPLIEKAESFVTKIESYQNRHKR